MLEDCPRCGQDHPRCTAHAKNPIRPCGLRPAIGLDKCHLHSGLSKQEVQQRGQRHEALQQVDRLARRAGVDQHPIDHLLDSLYRAAAEVEVFGQFIIDLDNKGEVEVGAEPGRQRGYAEWTTEYDPVSDKHRRVLRLDPLMIRGADSTVHMHPFLKEYNDALERRARFAKMAMDAGVAERQVYLAEQQASQLAGAVRSILTELGVQLDKRAVAVVQRNLRALGEANPVRGA